MILGSGIRWLVTFCLLIPKVNLQIPMQLYQIPPLFAFPPPLPPPPPPPPPLPSMSFQIALPMPIPATKPRTTTTERSIGVAVPIQLPFPIQVAIPAQPPPDFCLKRPRLPSCPVCPPCLCTPCTPSFFAYCSPCHQKCRCRDAEDAPVPLPRVAPMPVAGPAYPVALPSPFIAPESYAVPYHRSPRIGRTYDETPDDDTTDDSDSSSSEWIRYKHRRKNHITRRPGSVYRRSFDSNVEINDDQMFKPVLSYLTRDGAVKLEKSLSDDEAEDLLEENSVSQKVVVTAEEDAEKRQRLRVVSQNEKSQQKVATRAGNSQHRQRQVYLNPGNFQHMLAEGKKELVFNPPYDKKISNLSVSFQIV